MARHKNADWNLPGPSSVENWTQAGVAVLMDIRDEPKEANRSLRDIAEPLRCRNFLNIPAKLDAIQLNTKRKPRKKAMPKTEGRAA